MSGEVRRGEVWWASLAEPHGSEPGYRHPVLIVQADAFNRSAIGTVLAVVITSNVALAAAPGNVLLSRRHSHLPRESVVNVSQVVTFDRSFLERRVARLSADVLADVDAGLRLVLDLGAPLAASV